MPTHRTTTTSKHHTLHPPTPTPRPFPRPSLASHKAKTLLKVESQMSSSTPLNTGTNALISGNTSFSSGNFHGSVLCYTTGIDALSSVTSPQQPSEAVAADTPPLPPISALLAVLHSNRAAASLLLSDGVSSLDDANIAVQIDPHRCKFHGRCGAALHFLGRLEDAAAAYQRGIALPGGSEHAGLKEGLAAVLRSRSSSSSSSSSPSNPIT